MYRSTLAVALLLAAHATAMAAQEEGEKSCVAVEVNGVRTLPYECLSEQLLPPAARTQSVQDKGLEPLSARVVIRPSNELGLFNRSATSIRMGSNLGHSVQPQRPPPPSAYSPLVPGR